MKTSKLITYFIIVIGITFCVMGATFIAFASKKNQASEEAMQMYRISSTQLILDRVYEDLIVDNFTEAKRKLSLLKESRIIDAYEIYQNPQRLNSELEYCENVYFDKVAKKALWGKLCLSFNKKYKDRSLIDFKGISFIVLALMVFIILFVIGLFKFIERINVQLHCGIKTVLENKSMPDEKNSFWEPVLKELYALVRRDKENEEKIFNQIIELEKIEMVNQVSHDIRSPLMVLENIDLDRIENFKDKDIFQSAIGRLRQIASTLLEKNRGENNECSSVEINSLLRDLAVAKEYEYQGRKIYFNQIEQHYVFVNRVKLESSLSNLITNAIEASSLEVEIIASINNHDDSVKISIKDKGRGIPEEILGVLGREKISFNKKDGNGIGVYSAAQNIKKWSGQLSITSELGVGTEVRIILPLSKNKDFLKTHILLDNDELVCLTWESRARSLGLKFYVFRASSDLFMHLQDLPYESIFYIDSELDGEKGEDVAKVLFEKGYKNLNMCTGHSKEKFYHLSFIKNVLSKKPPF